MNFKLGLIAVVLSSSLPLLASADAGIPAEPTMADMASASACQAYFKQFSAYGESAKCKNTPSNGGCFAALLYGPSMSSENYSDTYTTASSNGRSFVGYEAKVTDTGTATPLDPACGIIKFSQDNNIPPVLQLKQAIVASATKAVEGIKNNQDFIDHVATTFGLYGPSANCTAGSKFAGCHVATSSR